MSKFSHTVRSFRDRLFSLRTVARLLRDGHKMPKPSPNIGGKQVLIGPANSAGQGYSWARALESARPSSHATAMQFVHGDEPYSYPIDQSVINGFAVHSRHWQRGQQRSLARYQAVLVESAMPILGGLYSSDPVRQIESLRESGVNVALIFHGSDLRDPDKHLSVEPLSYFAADPVFTEQMRMRTNVSRQVIAQTGLPVFVSTPDLIDEVDGTTWLPVVVDTEYWSSEQKPFEGSRKPKVLHAPSSSHIKGTELIEPVLRQLHEEGVIEYYKASKVPHSQMRQLVCSADIVIDQMRGGPYGVAACEAMAAGRLVISHVRDEVRERTLCASGRELPIVEAIPSTLEAVLREVVSSTSSARVIAAKGQSFVRHWHDGRQSGKVLSEWVDQSLL